MQTLQVILNPNFVHLFGMGEQIRILIFLLLEEGLGFVHFGGCRPGFLLLESFGLLHFIDGHYILRQAVFPVDEVFLGFILNQVGTVDDYLSGLLAQFGHLSEEVQIITLNVFSLEGYVELVALLTKHEPPLEYLYLLGFLVVLETQL